MSAIIDKKPIRGLREIGILSFFTGALFLLLALFTFNTGDAAWTHSSELTTITNCCGVLGAWIADVMLSLFGLSAYLFPFIITWHGYLVFAEPRFSEEKLSLYLRSLGSLALIVSSAALSYLYIYRVGVQLPGTTGGYLGQEIGDKTLVLFGNSGATLFLIMLFLSGLTLTTNLSWLSLIDAIGRYCVLFCQFITYGFNYSGHRRSTVTVQIDDEIYQPTAIQKQSNNPKKDSIKSTPSITLPQVEENVESNFKTTTNQAPPKYIASEGVLPSLALLDERDTRVVGYSETELEEMSRLVEAILADFNVAVTVVGFYPGPVITRFELQPAAGVKVSRISTLSKDLARALSVTSVRIVEIIPGKSVVGLEIPNRAREMVTLRELLVSPNFVNAKSMLTLAMGKDIAGAPMVADLGKMPHALVAGTTGSGKSVAINTMILSLLYKATPEEVRMIMIDPKMLELSVYEGIPHLLTPVVTDMKEASNALRWAVAEMERRYKLMSKMGVRNLAGFNQLIDDAAARGETIKDPMYQILNPFEDGESFPVLTKLPSIVIVIDELADMMMIVGKKVEELIARLAQKARAAGIHLILATQRPSVDVLTGLIKANVPTRISFQVSSRIDSRTILDQGGAETLLGNGDMLFLPSGTSIPIRAHGAFVDDHEVHRVVEFLKQTAPPNYLEDITRDSSESNDGYSPSGDSSNSESDALYDEAVQFVTETRKASISSVQRRFKVGYNRAATMIEAMEAAGVVSSAESNGSRVVLAPPPIKD
ncbi:MAG: DNA translocase FtsK 4TM domain-containing protein [Methylococcales bacterium]|nr:DNA translocase FtsK 4TM domain-containing protein [Methylococcales bacterium]